MNFTISTCVLACILSISASANSLRPRLLNTANNPELNWVELNWAELTYELSLPNPSSSKIAGSTYGGSGSEFPFDSIFCNLFLILFLSPAVRR